MTVWDRINEYRKRAQETGDRERLRLSQILGESWPLRRAAPDAALALYDQGIRLAERLGEPWWVMLFQHWRLQVLLYDKRDATKALDSAVRCAMEVRKPTYAQLPQRVCLHEDLILAYVTADPVGNAPLIEEALSYITAETSADLECFSCLHELWMDFEISVGQLDEALKWGFRLLARCQTIANPTNRAHHLALCYSRLCQTAYARSDWAGLLQWATAGEEAATSPALVSILIYLVTWRAVALRQRGEERVGRRTYLRAAAMADRLASTLGPAYFDAASAYHELGGELEAAYRIRGRELAGLIGRGRVADECHCHLERCRLLKLIGQPFDDELVAAREAAQKLKNPEPFLADLEGAIP